MVDIVYPKELQLNKTISGSEMAMSHVLHPVVYIFFSYFVYTFLSYLLELLVKLVTLINEIKF